MFLPSLKNDIVRFIGDRRTSKWVDDKLIPTNVILTIELINFYLFVKRDLCN